LRGGGADAVPLEDLGALHAPLAAALEAAARRVLGSGRYVLGPELAAFEREAAAAFGVAHAVGVSSGTDALLALLMAEQIGPGDEVVTTPLSFVAAAAAVARVGARPVFADVDPETLNLDPDAAAARLGARTRAAIAVHLFGRVARTAPLEAACAARGIPLYGDAAQAAGAADASGRPAAAVGRAAALSFFPSKNLGGFGDGGMVLTDDGALAERLRLVRVHGASPRHHHVVLGGNFRLDELQAALLRVKLPELARWTAARRALAAGYADALGGTPLALPPTDPGCVWNQYVVRVPDGLRDALAAHLGARGVATAVYYPEPLHLQPCFAALGHGAGDFPVAEGACREVLALPVFPTLGADRQARVVAEIRAFFEDRGGAGRPADKGRPPRG